MKKTIIKKYLNIEQMRYLESLGVDISDASLIYVKCPVANELSGPQVNTGQFEPGDCYVYTLHDIMRKLPNIETEHYTCIPYVGLNSCMYLYEKYGFFESFWTISADTDIDAAYEMLIWILTQNPAQAQFKISY